MNEEHVREQASSIDEAEFESVFAYRPKNKKAPYGVKKDGTPKKKPGRKL